MSNFTKIEKTKANFKSIRPSSNRKKIFIESKEQRFSKLWKDIKLKMDVINLIIKNKKLKKYGYINIS